MRRPTAVAAAWTLALLTACGCSRNPATGSMEVMFYSTEEEIAMGESVAPQFEERFGGLLPDDEIQEYVGRVGRRVADASDREMPYRFAVLYSTADNAFSLPGGRVYLTASLLGKLGNEHELAALLGHEIAHVAARHVVKVRQRNVGGSILKGAAGFIPLGSYIGLAIEKGLDVGVTLADRGFSRSEEYQADEIGIRYAAGAGYNPWGMAGMLRRLGTIPESLSQKVLRVLSTHPGTEDRVQHAREIIEKQYPTRPHPPAGADAEFRRILTKLRTWSPPPKKEESEERPALGEATGDRNSEE